MSRLSEQTQSSGTQFSVVHSVVLDRIVDAGGKMAKTESIDDAQEVVAVEVSYGLRSRDVVVTATLS